MHFDRLKKNVHSKTHSEGDSILYNFLIDSLHEKWTGKGYKDEFHQTIFFLFLIIFKSL